MNTLDKVMAIISKNLKNDKEVKKHTDLRKELDIDSFDALMIMNEIDDEYGISIDEDDFREVNTPSEIVNLLKNKYGINEI